MIKRLTKDDILLIMKIYQNIGILNEDKIKMLYREINISKIVIANIENESITSMLICNIINNNYYLDDVIFVRDNYEEINTLFIHMMSYLKEEKSALNIIYNNAPFSEYMHNLMLKLKFNINNINLTYTPNNELTLINDKIIITDHIEYNSNLNISNNVALLKENEEVVGSITFGLINESILISELLGKESAIKDLLNFVKSITDTNINITLTNKNISLINILLSNGFKIIESDYIYNL